MQVIVQKWEESEKGWGVRPSGYSLHLTEEGRVAFIKAYEDKQPAEIPDEYDRPCDKPTYKAEVSAEVYDTVVKSEHGVLVWSRDYPKPWKFPTSPS